MAIVARRTAALRWALAGLALILLADLTLAYVLWNERERVLSKGRETVAMTATSILRRSEGLFEVLDRTLEGVAEASSARSAALGRDDLHAHRLLVRNHAHTPAIDWLIIADTDGRLILSSRNFPAQMLNVSDREYILAQQRDWSAGLYIGLPIVSRSVGSVVIPVSRRIENDGGRFMGIIAAGLKIGFVQSLIDDPGPPAGLVIGVFRGDGHALACLPSIADCPDAPLRALDTADSGTSDRAMISDTRLLGDGKGLSAVHASQKNSLFVVADYPASKLLSDWQRTQPIYVALGLGANIAFVLICIFAFRQVNRRNQALAELAHSNHVLEDRVRERTEDLARLANTDVLTGLPNRRMFMHEGARLLALARRHQHPLSLMIVDADHFKRINDEYGHAAGDAVLCTLSGAPAGVLRTSDLFARLGGEEFAVLLPETGREGAKEVGGRLLEAFRDSVTKHEDRSLRFTVSIGMTCLRPGDADLEALLHRADAALYRAKAEGRDRLVSDCDSPPSA